MMVLNLALKLYTFWKYLAAPRYQEVAYPRSTDISEGIPDRSETKLLPYCCSCHLRWSSFWLKNGTHFSRRNNEQHPVLRQTCAARTPYFCSKFRPKLDLSAGQLRSHTACAVFEWSWENNIILPKPFRSPDFNKFVTFFIEGSIANGRHSLPSTLWKWPESTGKNFPNNY